MHSQQIPTSHPVLQEQVMGFTKGSHTDGCKASSSWLELFDCCLDIRTVNPDTMANWKEKLPNLVDGYKSCGIYNINKIGLFYCGFPGYTLAVSLDMCKGGKHPKEHTTVSLFHNIAGYLKIVVIGQTSKT